MKKIKTAKKLAKKIYENVPKKKLVNKAANYGIKQFVGGPYLDILSFVFKKSKKTAINYAGSYAYDSFLRSKFAREKINSLPMIFFSIVIKFVFNFLLLSRLKVGYKLIDFIISVVMTVLITLLTPFFYTSIKAHEDLFSLYTDYVIDRFMGPEGWGYIEDLKNKVVFTVGFLLLIILQFVEINSRYLQEMIVHTLITGFVSDKIQQWIDNTGKPKICHYGMFNTKSDEYMLGPYNYVSQRYKTANICHTDNRIIVGGKKPIKANIVNTNNLENYSKPDNNTIQYECIDIVSNYDPSLKTDLIDI